MNEEQLKYEFGRLAKELVPDGVDLWPAIQQRLMTGKKRTSKEIIILKPRHAHSRKAGLVFVCLLILGVAAVASFLTVPSLRAFAHDLLRFSVKTNDIQTIYTPTAVQVVNPIELPILVQTVVQQMQATQQQKTTQTSPAVKYSIKLPTMLPKDWIIENIQMGTNGDAWVSFVYELGGCRMDLIITPASDLVGTILGPEGKVESITMGNITAEYVRGSWTTKDGHSILHQVKPAEAKNLTWADDAGIRKLRWIDGTLNYLLVSYGASAGEPGYLGKIDLSIMADNFKPVTSEGGVVNTKGIYAYNGTDEIVEGAVLTPDQLEALAGFDILQPAYLPANYQYDHGNHYTLGGNAVDLYYDCGTNPDHHYWTFYIYQAKMTDAEYQWELANSPKEEVGASAQIETVLINGVPAEIIQGNWREIMDTSGGTPEPVQRVWDNSLNSFSMKWYMNGVFYEMRTGPWGDDMPALCILTKDEFIAIAQGLK